VAFTQFTYVYFLLGVVLAYWLVGRRTGQNLLLLGASYTFYGWVAPWYCFLILISTVVDYECAAQMERRNDDEKARKRLLILSLVVNLGILASFKYFNFFVDNAHTALTSLGFQVSPVLLRVALPVGISFYTFQTLSYTIDVYRRRMQPTHSLLDFAVFVSCFPQLVAGPIERARLLLPQIQSDKRFDWALVEAAVPLLIRGYLKKLVIADNVALFVGKVYMLQSPSAWLLFAGTVAFAIQIYADFSAYTDLARGSARLLGLDLQENFDSPYQAISPSDFWRRWHITFSSWIRDYLYVPLGGSRVSSRWRRGAVVMTSMTLSGLWHGAAWTFVAWGVFHGVLLLGYRSAGLGGRWQPSTRTRWVLAWLVMTGLTLVGWAIFRAPSLGWLARAATNLTWGLSGDELLVGWVILGLVALYASPLLAMRFVDRRFPKGGPAHWAFLGAALVLITVFARDSSPDFIYFQF
jgi:alginate O-acetyltransferase complex protein AlgI